MYIKREKKRGSSLLRVALLSALIVVGTLFIQQMFQGARWARPFDPTPTPTLTAAFHITQGDIYFAEGQLQQAIDSYERAIAMEPENDIPYEKEALLLVYTGDTARALARAEQAVLLNPARPENLARYCQALDWEGHYSEAFDACECAIEMAPDYAPGYAYLAEVYADQADWIPARRTAQQAIDVDFQSPDAHHNMGYALEVQGRYDEAIEYYENAITLRPNLAPYYLSAGQTYYWLGRFEEAADRFGKAIKLNPTDPVGYDQIGWTYHTDGESIRAIDALQQALSVDPVYYRAWGRLATIYYLRQNYEEAIKNFPIAIDLAEKRFLQQARDIQIFTEIEGATEPESVPILQGRFEKDAESDNLTAAILPVEWTHQPASAVGLETCGHLIAQTLQNELIRVSPGQDINFAQVFSQTRGIATLDITSGELQLDMENLPPPQNIPYEVRIRYRPDEVETLGFVQPDADRSLETRFSFEGRSDAPTSYYYGMALSFVYLEPPRCEEAIPWLLKAVEKDPAYYNPAWAGFKICPTEDAPPTPLPTPTPLPEEEGSS